MNRDLALLLTSVLAAFLAGSGNLSAQKRRDKWKIDPYTDNKPALMAAAGYRNYGPFEFGAMAADRVSSEDIAATLEYVDIIWMETAHFRIGVQLPQWSVPTEAATKKKLRAELTELKKVLPKVNPKTRRLDPWLRAHLIAFRMEKLYAETMALFGVDDASFPQDPAKVMIGPKESYMGYGPYLGMRDKFLLLVVEKASTYQQYLKKYVGRDSKWPQRWHFTDVSSLLFACPTESDDFPLKHDTALHCTLAFNVSQNLLDGFRYYAYDLPVWIKEGFGHWNSRRVDGRWASFDQNEGSVADMKRLSKWRPYAKNTLSKVKKYAPFPTVAGWRDFGSITFNDHVMIFSRVDFLMSQGPKKWQAFLRTVKGRVDDQWRPDQRDLVGATREGLKRAYGLSFLNFDERWKAWVKDTYPSK
ncbi:MAG: hypothetical protein CMJ88_08790 [Planctomycetes bacterium]|nr:hypothetical protein [Planctomycetota bacterium]